MRSECVQAVSQALGRNATGAETRDIENRIRLAMRRLASDDPVGWQALTEAQRLEQAGALAAKDISAEASLRQRRTSLAILAHDRVRNYIDAQVAAGYDKNGLAAIQRLLVGRADGKGNIQPLEEAIRGIEAAASTYMTRSWNVASGRFLNMLRDPKAEASLVRALYGDKSSLKPFKDAAADFHEVAERLRQRFNAAGGDIGKLDNWGMPQSWSLTKVLQAGKETWTETMLPLLDRSRYIHDDGHAFSDKELREFLDQAWQSIATDGANKRLEGVPSCVRDQLTTTGVKSNRNRAERQIHLAGPDAHMQAMAAFSERGVMDAMMGHIRRLSRDIGLIEQFGPNADRQFAQFIQQEADKATIADPGHRGKVRRDASFNERIYNYLAGNNPPPPETWYGKAIQVWRDLNVLKLGGTAISSIGDYGTMYLTGKVNGIPAYKMFLNEIRALNPADKDEKSMAEASGLMLREYSQQLARYGGDIGSHGWSSKLANTFMKATMLPYLTEARRRSFGYGMLNQVGQALREYASIADLDRGDQRFLKHSGITEQDWQVMKLAQPEDFGTTSTVITPEAIYAIPDEEIAKVTQERPSLARDKAASRLMGFVYGEMDRAVVEPGVRTRIRLGADRSADDVSVGGLLTRSFSLFKSFSFELTKQQFDRALHAFETKRGSAAYLAALIASTTVLGAVANTIKAIAGGRDPGSLNPTTESGLKNWMAAAITGGGLGLYGDFLINTYGSHGSTLAESVAGPLIADAGSLMNVGQGLVAASSDPDASVFNKIRPKGASVVNTLKGYTGIGSLWYTRAAADRLIFNQLSDHFSPGYLQRMKSRARQQHQKFYWQPDKAAPDRLPDPNAIAASR